MDEDQRHARAEESEDEDVATERSKDKHTGAATGAVLGTVAVGPLGAPLGAAAGAVYDAIKPDPGAPPNHTHDLDAPCYDGCPAWHSDKQPGLH